MTDETAEREIYERHLVIDRANDPRVATPREQFEAFAHSVRDVLAQRWATTAATYARENPKIVYYLSMEFLIGRSLANNVSNLLLDDVTESMVRRERLDWPSLLEQEPDAGLGNGGLGRLAACFLDSMATRALPSWGYGLRYEYGMFRQTIRDGWQVEQADNWLRRDDPWEIAHPDEHVRVRFGCAPTLSAGQLQLTPHQDFVLIGVPYDRPIVGYGGGTVNTLRLWGAAAPESFDYHRFSSGDFVGALTERLAAESLTRVLYPDDSTASGRELRLVQEYFLVACALADIVRRFRRANGDWHAMPEKVAIQLNDTHPALAVPELMRILLDEAHLGWDAAWDITVRTLAYTNHTLLPEALEKWPLEWFELLLPRHLAIIFEINRRFLEQARARFPGDDDRLARLSLIEEGSQKQVRMANLAIVGCHSTNGVAAIHTQLLRTVTVRDLAEMFPERFNNKTNGVTPRRWLRLANPALTKVIGEAIGDEWMTDLGKLAKLGPLAADPAFRSRFLEAKRAAKARFTDWLKGAHGVSVDPDSIFDCQVKRFHEYKRQLMNALRVIVHYHRLQQNPQLDFAPRTFLFSGKAAPSYRLAKLVIKLINNLSAAIERDATVAGRLRVVFLPDYCVSLCERVIAAADVSNQISTAGYEASGTGNMKFMMNGALTVGTRDGANIEMAMEAGEENLFLFGLSAPQVAETRSWYDPRWHYDREPETRLALDAIFANDFSRDEPGIFEPLRAALLDAGDHYMHLADLRPYLEADARIVELYRDRSAWAHRAIVNVAASGKFSSDRAIEEYAQAIWHVRPCPVLQA
ncbi:MAG TPA: glycogen/starch/alpha-glucan phosphorylase [Steroidobacteraceae bacterium]|nr:glycogen/starch/alpha-glucan phosphorylase [Steroidobacteraceae bacterium]